MPLENLAEKAMSELAINGARALFHITVRINSELARALVKTMPQKVAQAVQKKLNTGEMSPKRLHALGKDTHQLKLDDHTLKGIHQALKESGINFSIEHTNNGVYYVHFQGQDHDYLNHIVERTFEKMGYTLEPDTLTIDPPRVDSEPELTPEVAERIKEINATADQLPDGGKDKNYAQNHIAKDSNELLANNAQAPAAELGSIGHTTPDMSIN